MFIFLFLLYDGNNSGLFCDTRRAVIVVNILSIVFAIRCLFTSSPCFTDRILAALIIVGLICNSLALIGSVRFNKTFVMVGLVWFCIDAVLCLVMFFDFIGAADALVCAYPHFFLLKEMSIGVLTEQPYPNEKLDCV